MADLVVPVLNEEAVLPAFLERVQALGPGFRLIFVDNGSGDGTLQILRRLSGAVLIEHGENLGYGRSLVDGLRAARADKVVIIDADCEYPPEAIPDLLAALDRAPVAYASRFLDGGRVDMSPTRRLGNRVMTGVFNLLYGQELTDLYTGMKALRREAYAGMRFTRWGFEHVVELAAGLARRGARFTEVAVAYAPRATGRSKMRHVSEAAKALWCLVRFRMGRHA